MISLVKLTLKPLSRWWTALLAKSEQFWLPAKTRTEFDKSMREICREHKRILSDSLVPRPCRFPSSFTFPSLNACLFSSTLAASHPSQFFVPWTQLLTARSFGCIVLRVVSILCARCLFVSKYHFSFRPKIFLSPFQGLLGTSTGYIQVELNYGCGTLILWWPSWVSVQFLIW